MKNRKIYARCPMTQGGQRMYLPLSLECLESRRLLATVTLGPIADNTLYESATGDVSNGAGQSLFAGKTLQGQNSLRRALLKFDIGAAVPSGATIDAVSLKLNVTRSISPAYDFSLYEVLADWGEGTTDASGPEGTGGPATTDSATWLNRFFSQSLWATLGGDFSETVSATTAVEGNGEYEWTGSGLVADVQKWLDGPGSQFGWLLKSDSEDQTAAGNAKRFASKENLTEALRPVLTIDYTVGANLAPTLDPISDPASIPEGAMQQSIDLTGITAGAGESQTLTVIATSSNPSLVPNPVVTYASPNSTGSLTYTPLSDQFGNATITVTVQDDGGTANGGVDTFTRSFTVTVTPINEAPIAVADEQYLSSGPTTDAAVVANDDDPDGDKQDLVVELVTTLDPAIGLAEVIDGQIVRFTPGSAFDGSVTIDYQLRDIHGATSETATLLIGVFNQNPVMREDVNQDTFTTPLDALLVINTLNNLGSRALPPGLNTSPFLDVSADGFVTPLDALIVINFLNANPGGEGESIVSHLASLAAPVSRSAAADWVFGSTGIRELVGPISDPIGVVHTASESSPGIPSPGIPRSGGSATFGRSWNSLDLDWSISREVSLGESGIDRLLEALPDGLL